MNNKYKNIYKLKYNIFFVKNQSLIKLILGTFWANYMFCWVLCNSLYQKSKKLLFSCDYISN